MTKLLASSGAVVATYGVGGNPSGLAFDGNNIWVTYDPGNAVSKVLAGTGAVVGTYSVGGNPLGIAFDGTNIWVANASGSTVTEIPVY
jgi:hypothetical protein